MSSAHDTGIVGSGQNLNLAYAAATLPAADRNPSLKTDLGTTKNSLIFSACECLVVPFNLNPKWHLFRDAARRIPCSAVEISFVDRSTDTFKETVPTVEREFLLFDAF